MLTGVYVLYRNSILKESSAPKKSMLLRGGVFAITFGAGIVSSLFGVGGGIIFVPAMLLVLGMTMQRAVPTSQLTLMITSLAGVFTHAYLGHPDYFQAAALSAGAFAGAQIGARMSRSAKECFAMPGTSCAALALSGSMIRLTIGMPAGQTSSHL